MISQDIIDIQAMFNRLEQKARQEHFQFFNIVDSLVKYRQELRLNKKYEESDAIRDILTKAGIQVTDGTAGLVYHQIPPELKNHQINDTWLSSAKGEIK